MKQGAVRSDYLNWLAQALSPSRPVVQEQAAGDLVLGYATGYDIADIAPFVRSLRAHFDGAAALIVDDDPDLRDFLRAHDVIALSPRSWADWSPHPVMQRFEAFDRLLEQWEGVNHVLVADVRDVVFQASPFTAPIQSLEVFIEADQPLSGHPFNMKHLRALSGAAIAEQLANRPCLCIGTVVGTRSEVRRLCRQILTLAATPRSVIGGAFGADQAAFNLAVHQGLIAARIQANYGRVATLGMTDGATLSFTEGRIVNPDGGFSPIVHQHDRHPHLDAAVHALWGHGLEHRKRVRPKSLEQRLTRWRHSLRRRTPELR